MGTDSQSSRISGHYILFVNKDLPAQSGAGQVKCHIRTVLRQNLFDALVGAGSDDADIEGIILYCILLCFLFFF